MECLGACIMFCVSSITWAGRGYLTNSVVGLVLIWAMVRVTRTDATAVDLSICKPPVWIH